MCDSGRPSDNAYVLSTFRAVKRVAVKLWSAIAVKTKLFEKDNVTIAKENYLTSLRNNSDLHLEKV